MFSVVLPWHNNKTVRRCRTLRAAIIAAADIHDEHGFSCSCQGAVVMDRGEVRATSYTYHQLKAVGIDSTLASAAACEAEYE